MVGELSTRNDFVWQNHYMPTLFPRATAADPQNAIEFMIKRKLLEMAMNRFEWTGLPKEVDIRWLELNLCYSALSVFYYDTDYDKYFAMSGSPIGQHNMIGNPVQFRVYGNTMIQKTLDIDECVPIWANYLRYPDVDVIDIYAHRLALMDRTIEINALQARRTKILAVTENGKLTAANLNKLVEEGAGVIPVDQSMDPNAVITNIDLAIDPDSIISMHMLRSREWAEAMTMLGINNANQDKKERLVASEVSGNDDMIATIRATNLQARQQACKLINEMFPDIELNAVPPAPGSDEEAKMQGKPKGVWVDYMTNMNTATLKDTSPGNTSDNQTKDQPVKQGAEK